MISYLTPTAIVCKSFTAEFPPLADEYEPPISSRRRAAEGSNPFGVEFGSRMVIQGVPYHNAPTFRLNNNSNVSLSR